MEFYVYFTGPQNPGGFEIIPTNMELAFAVVACKGARLTLYKSYNGDIAYQLVIGGEDNSKVYLTREDDTDWPGDQESDTPNILCCTAATLFRFRWGPNGFNLLGADGTFYFYWNDPYYLPVYSVKVSTEADTFGSWSFTRSEGI